MSMHGTGTQRNYPTLAALRESWSAPDSMDLAAPEPKKVNVYHANGPNRHINGCVVSGRELQVLQGFSKGHTTKVIAEELFLSPNTVKTHAARIYKRLGATSQAHAVAMAIRAGAI